jgi:group I intron endonuclease
MTAGIYVIRNQINGHEYVGKTTNFSARWKDHRSQLRRRVHPNPYLTYAWHCYGEAAFEFRILEVITDLTRLDDREQSGANFFGRVTTSRISAPIASAQ